MLTVTVMMDGRVTSATFADRARLEDFVRRAVRNGGRVLNIRDGSGDAARVLGLAERV